MYFNRFFSLEKEVKAAEMDWGGSSMDWGAPPKSSLKSDDDDLVLEWNDDDKGFVI